MAPGDVIDPTEAQIRRDVEQGYDEVSTRAALAAGMSWAQIRERDRGAARLKAWHALISTAPADVTDEMIRAAGLDPAVWRTDGSLEVARVD
jgi:hypothetical protein